MTDEEDFDDAEFDETETEADAEVHVTIEPREDVLSRLGIARESFEESLSVALDEHLELVESLDDEDEMPSIHDVPVKVGEKVYRLSELADVQIESYGFDESE